MRLFSIAWGFEKASIFTKVSKTCDFYKNIDKGQMDYIVTCQAHPVLVNRSSVAPYFLILSGLSVCKPYLSWRLPISVRSSPPVDGLKDPWPRVLSRPGAKAVRRRPRLAGTRQYITL